MAELDTGSGSRPVPDPTLLTTQQLYREISALREALLGQMQGTDRLIAYVATHVDKLPSVVDEKLREAQSLNSEKFRSIDKQLEGRDKRDEQTAKDSKTAIDAALLAAKSLVDQQNNSNTAAINKNEANTAKLIEQLQTLLQVNNSAADGKISDLKDRMTLVEGKSVGSQEVKTSQMSSISVIAAVIGIFIGFAELATAVVAVVSQHHP